MIKKTKTYEALEEQDVERLVSEQLGKPVKLSEIYYAYRLCSVMRRV